MTRQREITAPTPLLDAAGNLASPGYARQMLFDYDRRSVRGRPFALKEWDFYQIMLSEYILQMTIGHVSYMANFSANLFSPQTGERHSFSVMRPLPGRRLAMPERPDAPYPGPYHGRGWEMGFDVAGGERRLWLRAPGKDAEIDIVLGEVPGDERMVIATPFDKPGQFYLNCKENYYSVRGQARFGVRKAVPAAGDTALLDWGRGVWPFHQEWFWGNGAANLPEGRFAFNIGWGFGQTDAATENMFFLGGKAHKLGALRVTREEGNYLAPWRFEDEGGLFDFTMVPRYDNDTQTKALFVDNRCHQVFGLFSGRAVLPGGKTIRVADMPGFCEHAVNNW